MSRPPHPYLRSPASVDDWPATSTSTASRPTHASDRARASELCEPAAKLTVLIASDLASRGIDVEGITHVVNYDLPEDPDLYVHRIGRTARAGRDGVAWALVTTKQGKLLSQIEDLINAEIPKMDYPDFEPSERPEGFRDEPTGGRPIYEVTGVGDKPRNRFASVERPDLPKPSDATVDPSKFPGGIVPTPSTQPHAGRIRTSC